MVGNRDRPGHVVGARDLVGEDRREQVVGPHALEWHGHAPATLVAHEGEGAGRVPAPAVREHRRREGRLRERLFDHRGRDHLEDALEREAVLLAE
jgi:hypothetical protein